MGDTLSTDIRHKFLTIIAERLLELDAEMDRLKRLQSTANIIRKRQWTERTIQTNLKWRAVLILGRFATVDQLAQASASAK